MFLRKLTIERIDAEGRAYPCPIAWIDNFAMRNFTNDAVFDDTLPVDDGLLEAGFRVPLDRLQAAMEDWFRRKGYLHIGERIVVTEQFFNTVAVEPPEGTFLKWRGKLASRPKQLKQH